MSFTIELIFLFVFQGLLFLCIVLSHKLLDKRIKQKQQVSISFSLDDMLDIWDMQKDLKQLKHIKRFQMHSQKREREMLKLVRAFKKTTTNKPIRIKLH